MKKNNIYDIIITLNFKKEVWSMKEYNYQNIPEDTHIMNNWTPLKFTIKDNYKYINKNPLLTIITNILDLPIYLILYIHNKIFYGYKIINKQNIIKNTGFVSVSNHIHPMDCTMVGLIYYPTLSSNFKIPFIRHLIKFLNALPIPTKESHKKEFYRQINEALTNKKIVHMYPEGSLWPYYEKIRHFKYGAFKMAVDANVPIQPIRFELSNPTSIFKLYKKKKCIKANILPPIYPNQKLDRVQRIEDLLERTYQSIKGEIK